MQRFKHSGLIDAPAAEVFAWHERPGALERLTPPWLRVRVQSRNGGIRDDGRTVLEIRKGLLGFEWEALHRDYRAGEQFVDEQVRGPFRRWVHTHRVEAVGAARCRLIDRIAYDLPGGAAGWLARPISRALVAAELERTFFWRHARTARDVVRHARFANQGAKRIVIAGASGLVGTQLRHFLGGGGHRVETLVRRPADAGEIAWDPERGEIDAGRLDGCDAVVHLGGVSIAKRFTEGHKRAVRESRVRSTQLLAETLARLTNPPKSFTCASAVGYYGDRGDELLTEESAAGRGFLPDVCSAWERACDAARTTGIRVVQVRFGLVLSPLGGALRTMLRPFKLGLGGPIGSGAQYVSWIGLDDVIGAIHHCLFEPALSGPVNVVGPAPVTNHEFTKTLGRVLRRPTVFPVPEGVISAVLGEMGRTLLLGSTRAVPARLEKSGFEFQCPTLESALRWELGL